MKTQYIIFLLSALIGFSPIISLSQVANEVKIGTMVAGELKLTNEQYLIKRFNERMDHKGRLSGMSIAYSPDKKEILLTYKVQGNPKNIRCIGITMKVMDDVAYVFNENSELAKSNIVPGGGSCEVTCSGEPCTLCELQVTSWRPFLCSCKCLQENCPSCRCNMAISSSINIKL
jgi:hypothetical protein